jgi:hypothetical protein
MWVLFPPMCVLFFSSLGPVRAAMQSEAPASIITSRAMEVIGDLAILDGLDMLGDLGMVGSCGHAGWQQERAGGSQAVRQQAAGWIGWLGQVGAQDRIRWGSMSRVVEDKTNKPEEVVCRTSPQRARSRFPKPPAVHPSSACIQTVTRRNTARPSAFICTDIVCADMINNQHSYLGRGGARFVWV